MGHSTPADLAARCQPIELLVADVDGVLTDGVIVIRRRWGRNQALLRQRRDGLWQSGTAPESKRRSFPGVGRRPSIAALPN